MAKKKLLTENGSYSPPDMQEPNHPNGKNSIQYTAITSSFLRGIRDGPEGGTGYCPVQIVQ